MAARLRSGMLMQALLVVESRPTAAAARDSLTRAGFGVVERWHLSSAQRALIELGPFDLAVVEWDMKDEIGQDLRRWVWEIPRLDSLRLVLIMPRKNSHRSVTGLKAGRETCIFKPLDGTDLTLKLEELGLL